MKLFVYGTLLENGNIMNVLLEKFKVTSFPATYNGRMYNGNDIYPIVIKTNDPGDIVNGIVYELDDYRILDVIDFYEGYNKASDINLFTRIEDVVIDDYNLRNSVYIYVSSDPYKETVKALPLIEDGDWMKHVKEKEKCQGRLQSKKSRK